MSKKPPILSNPNVSKETMGKAKSAVERLLAKRSKQTLGKRIVFPSKSIVDFNEPGYKVEYCQKTVVVLIGIGKDHTADLIMNVDAWEALKAGAIVNIEVKK